jgi:hypothetical protein
LFRTHFITSLKGGSCRVGFPILRAGVPSAALPGKRLHFKKAVIASGASPQVPGIPGLATAGYFTNETIFSLTALPPRLQRLFQGWLSLQR